MTSAAVVQVTARTCEGEPHQLFDRESTKIRTDTMTIGDSATLSRTDGETKISSSPLLDQLLHVKKYGSEYWLESQKKLWLVVNEDCKLEEGDAIKLGRFQFIVRQLAVAPSVGDILPKLVLDAVSNNAHAGPTTCRPCCPVADADQTCRYCLMPQEHVDDPLIAPCKCSGGTKHVHLECLRHWIRQKIAPVEQSTAFNYQPPSCELCRADYSRFVGYQNLGSAVDESQRVPLFELPDIEPPFIVLEPRSIHKDKRPGFHIMSLADGKVMKLGRGRDNDVRITDMSLSRCHAKIRFEEGHFYLQDDNSKFGTLLQLTRRHRLESSCPITVQVGRTVLSFAMEHTGLVHADPSCTTGTTGIDFSIDPTACKLGSPRDCCDGQAILDVMCSPTSASTCTPSDMLDDGHESGKSAANTPR